jgi:uncharacterized membrane protein YdjX (TVP38/TMEM64 family)
MVDPSCQDGDESVEVPIESMTVADDTSPIDGSSDSDGTSPVEGSSDQPASSAVTNSLAVETTVIATTESTLSTPRRAARCTLWSARQTDPSPDVVSAELTSIVQVVVMDNPTDAATTTPILAFSPAPLSTAPIREASSAAIDAASGPSEALQEPWVAGPASGASEPLEALNGTGGPTSGVGPAISQFPPPATDRAPVVKYDDVAKSYQLECAQSQRKLGPVEEDEVYQPNDYTRSLFWELFYYTKNRNWKKKVMTVIIVAASACVLYDFILGSGYIQRLIDSSLEYMTKNIALTITMLIALFVVTTLLFIPPAILIFLTGYAVINIYCRVNNHHRMDDGASAEATDDTLDESAVAASTETTMPVYLGIIVAVLVSFVGCSLGAVLAFFRARYLMRDLIELFANRYPIIRAMDNAFGNPRTGFRVMLLLRLCPIIPFNGLNYIGGVTSISLKNFVLSLVGVFPIIIFWVIVGASATKLNSASTQDDDSELDPMEELYHGIVVGIGIVSSIVAIILVWKYAGIELQKEVKLNNIESWRKYKPPSVPFSSKSSTCNNSEIDDDRSEPEPDSIMKPELPPPRRKRRQRGRASAASAKTSSPALGASSADTSFIVRRDDFRGNTSLEDYNEHGAEIETVWKPPGPWEVLGFHHYEVPPRLISRHTPRLHNRIRTAGERKAKHARPDVGVVETPDEYHYRTFHDTDSANRPVDVDEETNDEEWFWIWV